MLALKGAFSSFPERIDGQNLSAINEAIITIANQVRLWAAKEHRLPKPFPCLGDALPVAILILISVGILEELLFYRLISGNRRLDRRLGTMKMKILIMLAAGRTSAAASKKACPACFFLFMRFPSLPSIVLHSPFFFQSVKKTRDIASATSLGQTCSLRFDGADFDFVDFSLFDFKD